MKKLYFILLLVCTQIFAQTPITKTLGEFSELKVYDLINVDLIKSDQNKIVISGKHTQDVRIVQKNNTLKIRMKLDKMFNGEDTNVKLYYTSVDMIDANEGAIITAKDPIKQYELELKTQEGGQISAQVNTKLLIVKSVTGGAVKTVGSTKKQQLNIRTGGQYNGSKTEAQHTSLFIKAGGVAKVNTVKVLDVKIFSGGDVFIYGTPKQLKQNKLFGGRIIFKD
ncbi:MAG: head GIN domain-containing protein [Flavobacteriaceae bacterium]